MNASSGLTYSALEYGTERLAARKMQQFPRRRQISKDVHGCINYLQTWLDDVAIQLLPDAETLWLPQ